MFFDFATTPPHARDKLIHATVVPRPIAWVVSMDSAGKLNMAPFSFFNLFAGDPPIVGLGIGKRSTGESKHTSRNIRETGEFVVNLVNFSNREAMNITGIDADIDEITMAGLTPVPSAIVRPPRMAESPVALECRLQQAVMLSPEEYLLIARIVAMHIDDAAVIDAEKYYIDTPRLDLIARMHGNGWYARTNDLFQMPRLKPDDIGQ